VRVVDERQTNISHTSVKFAARSLVNTVASIIYSDKHRPPTQVLMKKSMMGRTDINESVADAAAAVNGLFVSMITSSL